ncbi:MAG TPA: biotin--[acetyl-CoA-carboxylase] ligase [Catenuloplanes sp.]|jgi:BirA family biotin operon repressor/biotin-[acetyl-CoA-carboxylase] ligase
MPASPYTDLDRPPLNARTVQRGLVVPGGLWRRIDVVPRTGSTNADVLAAARGGEPEGLVLLAEEQTDGRGRLGRAWSSPPRAGLSFSVLLRPGVPDPGRGWPAAAPRGYGWLPLLAGVALLDTVTRLAEVPASLKWPNDLLVGLPGERADGQSAEPVPGRQAKCAGILAEVVGGDAAAAVVLGLGLNVTLRAGELPVGPTGLPATSLLLAGARATDRGPLLRALLRGLADWYARWRAAGGDAQACGLREAYARGCGTLGQQVRVVLPGGTDLTGTAVSIDPDGCLVVRTPGGDQSVTAGDVVHLR